MFAEMNSGNRAGRSYVCVKFCSLSPSDCQTIPISRLIEFTPTKLAPWHARAEKVLPDSISSLFHHLSVQRH